MVGTLKDKPDSFVTVNCVAYGDKAVNIRWFLSGRDVTDKSRGSAYAKGQITSELRVNFTSILEVKSTYKCKEVRNLLLSCTTDVACQSQRINANAGDRESHVIDVLVGT